MKLDSFNGDTIAAIATPPGKGGVGIIRVSGENSLKISKKILKKTIKNRIAEFSKFHDSNGKVMDEGIGLFFKGPKSFTGEDVLELQGHGGLFVLDTILEAVVKFGARLAKPGEFSKRAFLNGKMDLVQIESIPSLISAKSRQAIESAIKSLQGELSQKLKDISNKITELRIMIESTIDFSEDINLTVEDGTISKANDILKLLNTTITSLQNESILSEDVNVAIIGKPNSGKSSLLNILTKKNTSIVTDIPGTTRDILKENVKINDKPVTVIDTAGTRYSKFLSMENSINRVEQQGIMQIKSTIKDSDILLILEDTTLDFEEESVEKCASFIEKPYVIVENKTDLTCEKASFFSNNTTAKVKISIKRGDGIGVLEHELEHLINLIARQEGTVMTKRRHIEALYKCRHAFAQALFGIEKLCTIDLVAEDLKEAHAYISEITGEVTNEDILSDIFKGFCVGK